MKEITTIRPEPTLGQWLAAPFSVFKETLLDLLLNRRPNVRQLADDYMEHYRNMPERLGLLTFEKEVKSVREAVAKGHVNPSYLQRDMREWATYDRKAFYNQLYLLYYHRQMFPDANRVYMESLKGANIIINNKDGSETVNADYGRPINLKV